MSGQVPPSYTNQSGGYPPPGGYPSYYPPPRQDNSRVVAILIALLIVGGAGGAVWYGLQIALKNQQTQRQSSNIQATYAKAASLYKAGNYQEAAPLFQEVRQNPLSDVEIKAQATQGEAFCYRVLGQQAQERKDYPTAEQWFQRAVAVFPNDLSALEELRAVQKAISILNGQNDPSGTTAPNSGAPVPGSTPSAPPTPDPAQVEANKRAQDAQEILERGNQLFREGHRLDACREWYEATVRATGSPAAIQATRMRQENCSEFNLGG